MKTLKARHGLLAATLLALVLCLSLVATAGAATQSFPVVSAVGAVGFQSDGTLNFATFSVRAVGPAAPGEEHEPARGSLLFTSRQGVSFYATTEHIHAHAANGPFRRIDPALERSIARRQVRPLSGRRRRSPGGRADRFSVLITASGARTRRSGARRPWQSRREDLGNLRIAAEEGRRGGTARQPAPPTFAALRPVRHRLREHVDVDRQRAAR